MSTAPDRFRACQNKGITDINFRMHAAKRKKISMFNPTVLAVAAQLDFFGHGFSVTG
jgi:hypothetical protein